MKRITFLFLSIVLTFMGYSQQVVQDFENGGLGQAFGGAIASIEADPETGGTHGDVAKLTSVIGQQVWQGINIDLLDDVELTTDKTMQIDVYSLVPIEIAPKVLGGLNGAPDSTASISHTGSGWETLTITFNEGLDGTTTADGVYTAFVIYYNWDSSASDFSTADDKVFYVDNIAGNIFQDPCSKGIQDGSETGVDCGGSCDPCSVTVTQQVVQDFENGGLGQAFGGAIASIEADPETGGTQGDVAKLTSVIGQQVWQGINIDLLNDVELTTDKTMQIDVYSLVPIEIAPKVVGGLNGAPDSTASISHTGSGWETLTITFNEGLDGTTTANGVYTAFVIYYNWDSSASDFSTADDKVFYVDDITGNAIIDTCSNGIQDGDETGVDCGGSCAPCATAPATPSVAAPMPPARDSGDVISIYGDAYTNEVGLSNVPWDNSDFVIESIAGNDALKISFDTFLGTDLGTVQDATLMTDFHMDIWVADDFSAGQVINSKWSNHSGGAGETDAAIYTFALGSTNDVQQWVSIDVPLSDFNVGVVGNGISAREALTQFLIDVAGTIDEAYVDNIYLYKESTTGPSSVAFLSDLQVDNTTIAGFSSSVFNYDIGLPSSATVPQITGFTLTDPNASAVITQATGVPGDATVVVTAEDGTTTETYTVSYSLNAPSVAAPMPPARDSGNVISIYGDAYSNEVGLSNVPWDNSDFVVESIAGDDALKIGFGTFLGTDLGSVQDASEMDYFHMDVWVADAFSPGQVINAKWSNHSGGAGETDAAIYLFALGSTNDVKQWISIDVPLVDFNIGVVGGGISAREALTQFLIDVAGTIDKAYVDNIYLYKNPDFTYNTTDGFLPSDPNGQSHLFEKLTIEEGTAVISMPSTLEEVVVESNAVLDLNADLTADLTFESNASGTAQLADATNSSITGDVTVERFIPVLTEDTRAFRFLTSAVNSNGSIYDNWQEGGNSPAGYGTHITGSTTGANGFDQSVSGLPSMYTFDNSFSGNQDNAWVEIPDTDNTNLVAGKAYRMFIRGDRNYNLNASQGDPDFGPNTDVTLRATGDLIMGNKTETLSDVSGYYSLVGNPYQAVVNFNNLTTTNVNTSNYYVWDPNINTRGAYVTHNLNTGLNDKVSSATTEFIMPGQSFFVQTTNSAFASLEFTEASKDVTAGQTAVFSDDTNPSYINLLLYKDQDLANGGTESDGLLMIFSQNGNDAVDQMDAGKLGNPNENLARLNNGQYLSVDDRSLPGDMENLELYTANYSVTDYTFSLNANNISDDVDAYLIDNHTGDQTLMNGDSNQYSFTVDASIPGSIAFDRFSIQFEIETFGIDDNENIAEFKVYPNPVTDGQLTIISSQIAGDDVELNLYSMIGQSLLHTQGTFESNGELKLNLGSYQAGVYFIEVSNNGQTVKERLIIK